MAYKIGIGEGKTNLYMEIRDLYSKIEKLKRIIAEKSKLIEEIEEENEALERREP